MSLPQSAPSPYSPPQIQPIYGGQNVVVVTQDQVPEPACLQDYRSKRSCLTIISVVFFFLSLLGLVLIWSGFESGQAQMSLYSLILSTVTTGVSLTIFTMAFLGRKSIDPAFFKLLKLMVAAVLVLSSAGDILQSINYEMPLLVIYLVVSLCISWVFWLIFFRYFSFYEFFLKMNHNDLKAYEHCL